MTTDNDRDVELLLQSESIETWVVEAAAAEDIIVRRPSFVWLLLLLLVLLLLPLLPLLLQLDLLGAIPVMLA
jgi:ABC-type transport system involved in cytochrome c biogenesis permease component